MATSPNYGWLEPDNTDLVKNGALAIRTLGNAIDTTMATMVPKSIVDAKGDLIAGTAADTVNRLAVGNNGETLVADSSTSTGLRYQPTMAAGKNNVINGALDIWQRGTSIALASNGVGYTADRWYVRNTGSSTVTSRQATNDTTNLPFIQYCLRYSRDSGSTNVNPLYLTQSIETANSIPYAGRTVSYSFYARKGANFSGTISAQVYSGTGTDQNLINGYTGSVQLLNSAMAGTLTTTWQRYTFTFAVGATATELAVHFDWSPSGTAGAADYIEVTGFQLEIGSVATTFTRSAGTIQGELAACQRYLPAIIANNNNIFAFATNSTTSYVNVQFPVTARVAPTGITIPALSNFSVFNSVASSGTPTSIAFDNAGNQAGFLVVGTSAGSPILVAKDPMFLRISNANGYILFTGCEL